ncbi:hypothetical protein D3C72_1250400 [compost metagenome]
MQRRRVEQRHGRIPVAHQQHDLGAAQDDRLRTAVHQPLHHALVHRAGRFQHLSLHQFLVDDPVHLRTVIGLGHQHLQPVPLGQAPPVEILLHGECGAQQPYPGRAQRRDRLAHRIGDMQQRHRHRRLHLLGHQVHGIGADHQRGGATALQFLRRLHHRPGGRAPVAGALHRLDVGKVEGPQQQPRRVHPAQRITYLLVDHPVVVRRTFPAHPADQTQDLLHRATPLPDLPPAYRPRHRPARSGQATLRMAR